MAFIIYETLPLNLVSYIRVVLFGILLYRELINQDWITKLSKYLTSITQAIEAIELVLHKQLKQLSYSFEDLHQEQADKRHANYIYIFQV